MMECWSMGVWEWWAQYSNTPSLPHQYLLVVHSPLCLTVCAPSPLRADAVWAKVFRDVAHFVAASTAGFIAFRRPNQDNGVIPGGGPPVDQPLRSARFTAALLTDRVKLKDVVGNGEQPGHEAEGLPAKVLVQPGYDDVESAFRHSLAQ